MDNKPRKTLKDELQKRKTQQIKREIEARQISQTRPDQPVQDVIPPQRSGSTAAPHKRTTQTVPVGPSAPSRTSLPAWRVKPRTLIIIGSAVAALMLVLIVVILAGNEAPAPTTTQVPLPVVSAQDVINYLKLAGVPVSGLRTFAVPNETWQATQEFQFDVLRGDQKGLFLLLSYPSPSQTARDSFSVSYSSRFKDWQQVSISNILLLISPDSAKPIGDEIANHLSQYLIAPYRAFIKTSTGQPVLALATNAAGTSTALHTPTVPVTFVTLTPGSPENVEKATATPRPTNTLLPTSSPTTAPPIRTLPMQVTPIVSTPLPPAGNPTDSGVVVMTAVPSVTASGPLVEPQLNTAQAFVSGAPEAIGPFSLDKMSTTADAHRSTLTYTTGEGQQYLVVLWITDSAQEALDHYVAETSTVSGTRSISVGDEAIVAAPGNSLLAEVRYRNTVLAVYRPEQPNSQAADFKDDEITAFLTALISAIPG